MSRSEDLRKRLDDYEDQLRAARYDSRAEFEATHFRQVAEDAIMALKQEEKSDIDLDKASQGYEELSYSPQEFDKDEYFDNEFILPHLAWMAQNLPDGEKGHRWLGFIQGALWAKGYRTINDLRQDNIEAKDDEK